MLPIKAYLELIKDLPKYNVIYAFSDPFTNEIRYIGKAANLYIRIRKHYQESNLKFKTHKNAWLKSLLKQGLKAKVIIIEVLEDEKELNDAEIKWIKYYRTLGCDLTNGTDGGDGGKMPPDVIAKIKLTKQMNPQLGWWKDKKFSKEHCENLSLGKKGYVTSEDTKKKLSASHKGLNTWSKGRKQSQESIDKSSKTRTGLPRKIEPVYQLDKKGNIIKLWDYPLQAEIVLKISHSKINSVCIGDRKTTGGYKWCYVKDYLIVK